VARAQKKRRKADILAEYAAGHGQSSTLDPNSERWLDIIESTTSEDTENDSDIDTMEM
jgi:hypothetical protein